MAKGYWVVSLSIEDTEQYATYQAFVRPFLARVGGRFIVRGGKVDVVEGTSRERQVIIEFESYDAALAAYRSGEYQAGMQHRINASIADFVIVEGFDG